MARDGVAVDSRLVAAVAAKARGEAMDVLAVCRDLGVSRKTFYKYLARFDAEGVEGFFPRSRRPLTQPSMTSAAVADAIVLARKELAEEGWDNGAISIGWRLQDGGVAVVPARATIHRVLVRRGQVVPAPRKRPKRSRRFEAPFPNAMWQLDGFDHVLGDGTGVVVFQLEDDYSRLDLASRAASSENGADACAVFQTAVGRYGLPRVLLTDNGSALNGKRRGFTTDLEALARGLGVKPVASSVGHPQTCGKNERAHSTVQKWLEHQPSAQNLAQLQEQLEVFHHKYNTERRHQGIGGLTPQQRWDLADKVRSDGTPIPPPPQIVRRTVGPHGAVGVDGYEIGLGRRHVGAQATVFRTGQHTVVFIGATHIRTLELDPRRRYQPTGQPPGRPRQLPTAPSNKGPRQGGAPAAQRGRTTLTRTRDGAPSTVEPNPD